MNKKKTIIIVLIAIILIAILLVVIKNNFFLNTEFKYKVSYVNTMSIETSVPLSTEQKNYYEIDLQKKIVELRKDSIPTGYGTRNGNVDYYYRKLEYRKILTDEECNQLKKIFDKAINGTDMDYNQGQNSSNGFIDMGYYIIESKYKKDVVMLAEDEALFYNIVKK